MSIIFCKKWQKYKKIKIQSNNNNETYQKSERMFLSKRVWQHFKIKIFVTDQKLEENNFEINMLNFVNIVNMQLINFFKTQNL